MSAEKRARELLAESRSRQVVRRTRLIHEDDALHAIEAALTPQWEEISTLNTDDPVFTWHSYGIVVQNPAHPSYGKRGYALVQRRFEGKIFPSEVGETGRVTHWLPLPAPPEGEV